MMEKNEEEWSETENDLINILLQLQNISSKESAQILKIIPPSKLDKTGEWLSPWELMDGESHEPHQDKILFALKIFDLSTQFTKLIWNIRN